jgi:hypothetical protein
MHTVYIVFGEFMLPYYLYFFSLCVIHFMYALVFLGVFSAVPDYVYYWNILVQVGLCLFLMYRFHPFRTQKRFYPTDDKMIFGAATLLLFNIISLPLLYSYIGSIVSSGTILLDK